MSRPADRCHLVMSRHTPPVLLMDGQNLVDLMAQPMNTSGVQAKSWPVPRFFTSRLRTTTTTTFSHDVTESRTALGIAHTDTI